jgi:tyrosine-protein kinase Etk/Wzc
MTNDNISNSNDEDSINIREILLKYFVHWKWFILSMILFFIAAKIYLRYLVPIYKASTTILIKDKDSGGLASELSAFQDLGIFSGTKNILDDEIEILKSRTLIEKAVKECNLNITYLSVGRIKSSDVYASNPVEIIFNKKDDDFYKKDTIINIDVLSSKNYELFNQKNESLGIYMFGKEINSLKLGTYIINKKKIFDKNKEEIETTKEDIKIIITPIKKTAEIFKSGLTIAPLGKKTNVIELSYNNPVKEKAIDFLNKLISIYNREAIADKNMISEKTAKFINERLLVITSELEFVEKDVELYKKKNKITDIPTEAELYLKNASDYKVGSIETETQFKVVEMMIDFMRKSKDSDIIPANIIPDDDGSASLIGEYNNLVIERSRILKSSTEENPVVIRVEEKIKSLKSSIRESLNQLKSTISLKNANLNREGNIVGGRISQIPRQEREFRGIYRQQQIKEELYLYLFKKREETSITLAATAPISKIIDLAYSSDRPVSPNRLIIYVFSLLLGIMIPFLIIYISDLLDTKVKTRHDIESRLTIPFIGDIPHSDSHNEIMQSSSRTSSAEAIRIIRTNLEFLLSSSNHDKAKTIFLTSTLSGEGKTFVAINLAATIAISTKKVLLIGLDIRNPKLDEYVKLPNKGFTNYLSSKESNIYDFIVPQKGYDKFDILPAGVIPPNPAELLMNKKLEETFNLLKQDYDYIIVDTAPVSLVTDTLLISKNADAFIYVVRANYLQKDLLKIPDTLYKEKKLPNMCLLLNDTDIEMNGYGYGYGMQIVKKPWYKRIFSLK